ncbi:MAG: M1 family metallopeptidase [Gemmatimonadetes bacterium]|nr:M1 family metallopeptidase [Gemmatimonadota bacterium]
MPRGFLVLIAAGAIVAGPHSAAARAQTGAPAPATARPVPYPVIPPAEFRRAVERGTRTMTGAPGPKYWQQWATYKLNAKLDLERKLLEGTGRITYHNRSADTLNEIVFRLYQNIHLAGAARNEPQQVTPGFDVRRLAIGTQVIAKDTRLGAGYRINGTILSLRLPRPLNPGDSVAIAADWAFGIPQSGSGRMGWSASNLFFLAYWYPQVAVYDDVDGWRRDQYLGTAEFYMGYANYEVTVEAPRDWLVMATGELQNADSVLQPPILQRLKAAEASDSVTPVVASEDIWSRRVTREGKGGRLSWRFHAANVRDFAFSVTKESKWDAVRVAVGDRNGDGQPDYARVDALYRAIAPHWQHAARFGRHALAFHARYTGYSYPWSHMSLIEGEDIVSGGMEYPMLTLISALNDASDSLVYSVSAHELAHMWIPMIVGADETRYGWMDEGTTDFHETQARKDFYPGSDPEDEERRSYFRVAGSSREDAMMRWTDFQLPGAYTVSSYQKPATVLYALRELIGVEPFQRGLQTFVREWAYKHPTPWDFFHTFDRAAGRDLWWFWRSWFYETWTLDQAIAAVEARPDGAVITIEDKGWAPMPTRVTITLASGETIQREVPVDVWLRGAQSTTVTAPAGATVTKVEIDATQAFPDVDRANNVWTRTP